MQRLHDDLIATIERADDPDRAALEYTFEAVRAEDPALEERLRACAIPRRLDPEVVAALEDEPVGEEEAAGLLDRVAAFGFVLRREDGALVYHDNVRDTLLGDWRGTVRRERFDELNERLVALHDRRHAQAVEGARDLDRVAPVIQAASFARLVQIASALESRQLEPLLEALYHATEISAERGFALFSTHVEHYESLGRLGVCRALAAALEEHLAARDDDPAAAARAVWVRYWHGRLARDAGDWQTAEPILREVADAAVEDVKLRLWALGSLGTSLHDRNSLREARAVYEEELELAARTLADPWNLSVSYQRLGSLSWRLEEYDEAAGHYRRAVEAAAEHDNVTAQVYAHCDLSAVLAERGELDGAFGEALLALDLARTRLVANRPVQQAVALRFMSLFGPYGPALVDTLRREARAVLPPGDPAAALDLDVAYLEAVRLGGTVEPAGRLLEAAPAEDEAGPTSFAGLLLAEARARTDAAEAVALYDELVRRAERGEISSWYHAAAMTNRGLRHRDLGRWQAAEADLTAAAELWRTMGHDVFVASSHVWLASLRVREGRLDEAETLLGEWGEQAGRITAGYVTDYLETRGDLAAARAAWREAEAAYESARREAVARLSLASAASASADAAAAAAALGDWEAAAGRAEEARRLWASLAETSARLPAKERDKGDDENARAVLLLCSTAPDRHGEVLAARDLLASARERVQDNPWYHLNFAYASAELGEWTDAADAIECARRYMPVAVPGLDERLAAYRLSHGDGLRAGGDAAAAVALYRETRDRLGGTLGEARRAELAQRLGDALLSLGEVEAAAEEYAEAARAAGAAGDLGPEADARLRQAVVAALGDRLDEAVERLRDCVRLRDRLGWSGPFWITAAEAGGLLAGEPRRRLLEEALNRLRDELDAGGTMDTFSSPIRAVVPEGWSARDSIAVTSPDGLSQAAISGEPVDPGTSTEEYAERQRASAAQLPGYEELSVEPGGFADLEDAVLVRSRWTTDEGSAVTQLLACAVVGDRGYTAAAVTVAEPADGLETVLAALLGGTALTGPAPP